VVGIVVVGSSGYCGLATFGAFDFGRAVAVILAGGVIVRRSYGVSARTNVGGGAIIIVVRTVRSYILFISASALVPVVGCILVGNAIFVRMLKLGSNYELANRTFFSLFLGSRAVGNMICFRIGYGASVIFTYVPMSACIICPSFAEIVALCLRNNGRASGTGYGSCAISVICVSNVLSLAARQYGAAGCALDICGAVTIVGFSGMSESLALGCTTNRTSLWSIAIGCVPIVSDGSCFFAFVAYRIASVIVDMLTGLVAAGCQPEGEHKSHATDNE
jgi:hypothetical protein